MDAGSKEEYGSKGVVELRCDSARCWKCDENACKERFEELVFGIGP